MEASDIQIYRRSAAECAGNRNRGKITHEDYHNTLIPMAEAMMAKGPIRMLYKE